MPRIWSRSHAGNVNNAGYYGAVEMIPLDPGATILRTLWSINLWGTWGSVNQYPPGSSLCRAGIIIADPGLPLALIPTPISQADEEWMDLVTLIPVGQISTSTNVDWQYNWATPVDRNAKAQRKNETISGQSLYVSWEFEVASDALSGFGVLGWSSAADSYLNEP